MGFIVIQWENENSVSVVNEKKVDNSWHINWWGTRLAVVKKKKKKQQHIYTQSYNPGCWGKVSWGCCCACN